MKQVQDIYLKQPPVTKAHWNLVSICASLHLVSTSLHVVSTSLHAVYYVVDDFP